MSNCAVCGKPAKNIQWGSVLVTHEGLCFGCACWASQIRLDRFQKFKPIEWEPKP